MTDRKARAEQSALLIEACSSFETFCRALVLISSEKKDASGRSMGRVPLNWNPIQRRYCHDRTRRDVLLKSRRVGMTTLELARDVWRFLQPNEKVVCICQSDANGSYVKQFSRMVRLMFDGLREQHMELRFDSDAENLWTLPDRDSTFQIVQAGASAAAASKKGRGGAVTRLHMTEAAFFEYADVTYDSISASIPDHDSEIVIESTPNGANWFQGMFNSARSGLRRDFTPHFFAWFDDPTCAVALDVGEHIEPASKRERELIEIQRVSLEQLKWYRTKFEGEKSRNQDMMDQEYPSDPVRCFLTSGRKYFDIGALDDMAPRQVEPVKVTDDLSVWAPPVDGRKYVIGVDPAEGLGESGDWSYATVWDRKSHAHVATYRNQLQANPFADELVKLGAAYNTAEIIVERNKGMALIGALERLKYGRVYYDADDKPGVSTNTATRPVLLEELANAVRDHSLFTHDCVLLEEMRQFQTDAKTGKPFAPMKHKKQGSIGDDGIFSAAMAWRAMLRPAPDLNIELIGDRNSAGIETYAGGGWGQSSGGTGGRLW